MNDGGLPSSNNPQKQRGGWPLDLVRFPPQAVDPKSASVDGDHPHVQGLPSGSEQRQRCQRHDHKDQHTLTANRAIPLPRAIPPAEIRVAAPAILSAAAPTGHMTGSPSLLSEADQCGGVCLYCRKLVWLRLQHLVPRAAPQDRLPISFTTHTESIGTLSFQLSDPQRSYLEKFLIFFPHALLC